MNRIIFSDDSTLIDYSEQLSDYPYGSAVIPLVSAEDALYIGARFPLNNLYIKLSVPNEQPTAISIEYWGSDGWNPVVDKQDGTAGLTQSGLVVFTPDREAAWMRESTNSAGDTVDGLEGVVIYDRYWIRLKFSADLDATTEISWVGNKFSNDDDLAAEYPDLARSNVKTSFKAGKTDWEEQHVKAAEVLIDDLIDKKVIVGAGNIIDWREYRGAAVSKCAEIIFRSFGDDYLDRAKEAREEYLRRIDKRSPVVDRNNNGTEDAFERNHSTGWGSR